MSAQGKIHGRFGGRDAKGADTRSTLGGLRFAMESALAEHRKDVAAKSERPAQKPLFIENTPSGKTFRGCIHCHQVKEIVRQDEINAGTWVRESIYTYPLPENVGLTLDVDRGSLVRGVRPGSPAEKAGLKAGDVLKSLNQIRVHSFADAQFGLHKAPLAGSFPVAFQRDGKDVDETLTVAAGWPRTNVTWRPSLLDMLPAFPVYGTDLTAKEKKSLGLGEKRLAFRQDDTVHSAAKAMGVKAGDIILGVDGKQLDLSMEQFLGYVRQNYLIGDALTINVVRDGKRVDLPVKLK
jgi:S1-C subfamily serine protease